MTDKAAMSDVGGIVKGLEPVMIESLLTVDPDDVSRYHYHHFKGRSLGLFQVAPGWHRMELTPLGLAVRSALMKEKAR